MESTKQTTPISSNPAEAVKPFNHYISNFEFKLIGLLLITLGTITYSAISILNSDSRTLLEYQNMEPYTCYGGPGISPEYSILPTIYNTTPSYSPAQLHMTTIAIKPGAPAISARAVDLVIPTPASVLFGDYSAIFDFTVGDAMAQYNEFIQKETFSCFVKESHVVALSTDLNYINEKLNFMMVHYIVIMVSGMLPAIMVIVLNYKMHFATKQKQP